MWIDDSHGLQSVIFCCKRFSWQRKWRTHEITLWFCTKLTEGGNCSKTIAEGAKCRVCKLVDGGNMAAACGGGGTSSHSLSCN